MKSKRQLKRLKKEINKNAFNNKKIGEIIGIILILIFVGFFGIGSAVFMFLDKNKEDSDDSEIKD